jgi:alpha-ketoglutarate-dependent taurine dioxygenase
LEVGETQTRALPRVLLSEHIGQDLVQWLNDHCEIWEPALRDNGALLFRGFGIDSPAALRNCIVATSKEWASYRERATPRTAVGDNIFTSTEYPAREVIPLHNENSHCTSWPLKLYFCCVTPSDTGGETPLADCRDVLATIPATIRDEFTERGWRYRRHFGELGFDWEKVFGSSDRDQVETYCRENAMDPEWDPDDSLTVTYVRPAIHMHPVTGEQVWFNHGLFFNPFVMAPELREALLDTVGVEGLPYNTTYGDGEPVPERVLQEIAQAYSTHTRTFPWRPGDLLFVDNMLVAHGRRPFTGNRRVLVGMADPWPPEDFHLKT